MLKFVYLKQDATNNVCQRKKIIYRNGTAVGISLPFIVKGNAKIIEFIEICENSYVPI